MEKERNIEVTKLQGLVSQLLSELQSIKSHDEHEKNSIKHELSRMKVCYHQLNRDKHILANEIQSLNDQKLELQHRLQHADEQLKYQQTLIEENESFKKEALTTANINRIGLEERANNLEQENEILYISLDAERTEHENQLSILKIHLENEIEKLKRERLEAHIDMVHCKEVLNRRLQCYSDSCDQAFIDKYVKSNVEAETQLVRETARLLVDMSIKSQAVQTLIPRFEKDDQKARNNNQLNEAHLAEKRDIRQTSVEELKTKTVSRSSSGLVNISCEIPAKEHKEISQTIVNAEKAFLITHVSMVQTSENEILNQELKCIEGVKAPISNAEYRQITVR